MGTAIRLHKIGVVNHYYNKIQVAIIELHNSLSNGDNVRFIRGGEDLFDQTIESLQKEHKEVQTAVAGDIVGITVTQRLKPDTEVYLIEVEEVE